MWPYHPDLLATPVPRYTSYPTAAEFHDRIAPADMAAALDRLAPGTPVSLYVHIPYCREICWYCGCNTGAANRGARLAAYLEALHTEIDMVARRLADRATIGRIAFGGGSPNALEPAAFLALQDHLNAAFRPVDPVISIEIDPRTLDEPWAEALSRSGATRASLGVQTFSAEIQAAIGRVQPLALIERTTTLLRAAGITSLNFDLMYGLPGQTPDILRETLVQALALGPERLAVFGYAHVPHMLPRQKRIDAGRLPDARDRFDSAAMAHAFFTGHGYNAVGFDHFALPDDAIARAARAGELKRNFQGFTEDQAPVLIGLGASAISAFPDAYLQDDKNSGRYRMLLSAGQFPVTRGVARTAEDRLRSRIVEDLLCRGMADAAALADYPGLLPRLTRFEQVGLLEVRGRALRLTPQALPYARVIGAVFDAYRTPASGRFSAAI